MGHQRLGDIPKTQKWTAVVERLGGGGGGTVASATPVASVEKVSAEILFAAEGGLQQSINDRGLQFTFYLLTQIVLTARSDDWTAELAERGIRLHSDASVFDLTAEIQRLVSEDARTHGRVSTISEIAQQAACEAVAHLTKDKAATLFGSGRDELQQAIRKLSTKAGFSDLGQKFFGNFVARYLDFFASKILPGIASEHFRLQDYSNFRQALYMHCHQSAKIVHDFSGEWYSKTEWEKGITLDNSRGFIAVALEKLRAELKKQREAIQ